jgi:hypothetical protein
MMRWRVFALLAVCASAVCAAPPDFGDEEDPASAKKVEETPPFPVFPRPENLIRFDVGPTASNQYFVDASSLSVKEGTVHYVLVVKASGGAMNVSFEGMRCREGEFKLYGTGRADGSWSKARLGDWRRISEDTAANRYHAALSRDYFCPGRSAIANAEEGRDALRRGKNPKAD